MSFGAVAAAYERFRPGYPDELVDAVLDYADGEVRTALEIGAGTGKATRVFAARGIAVTATEPDAAMLAELVRHVPTSVLPLQGAFEDLEVGRRYDLVFAAAALHWTRAEGRWERVASLLGPGGVFASFGGQVCLADARLEDAVTRARAPWLASDSIPSPDGTAPESALQWPGTELLGSELFADVRQVRIERRMTMTAGEYVSHLSTISAYLELTPADRQAAFDAIRAVLPDTVAIAADLDLHLARLAG